MIPTEGFGTLLTSVILFSLLMIPGFVLGKLKKLSDASVASFSELLASIAMPALVFGKLLEADPGAITPWELTISLALPFIQVPAIYFFMKWLKKMPRRLPF